MIRLSIILVLITYSCNSAKKDVLPVSHYYDIKKNELRIQKLSECKERAINDAASYIDSIIDKIADKKKLDTLVFPTKPIRPNRPNKPLEKSTIDN